MGPARRGLAALASGALLALVAALPAQADPTAAVPAPAPVVPQVAAPPALPACTDVVAALSPRAKLAQRLVVGVEAGDVAATVATVRESQVGGIFVGGNETALLTGQALRGVQAVSRIPLSVAVDDEGGRVQRIDRLDGEMASARVLAEELSLDQVRELAAERGRMLAARGVTVDYAPVADLGGGPTGAVIGDRAFSADPGQVIEYAGAFAAGLRAAGITPVFKHFPGHGNASGDSHQGRVTTPPLTQLRGSDLLPYETLPQPGDGVMVGHLDVPGLTDGLPTTLTPAAYELLRRDYGFDGVVVTDDLGAMKAISGRFPLPEAVAAALAAGADQALWSSVGDPGPVLAALEQALSAGRLDAAANDVAVTRVLAAKGACAR